MGVAPVAVTKVLPFPILDTATAAAHSLLMTIGSGDHTTIVDQGDATSARLSNCGMSTIVLNLHRSSSGEDWGHIGSGSAGHDHVLLEGCHAQVGGGISNVTVPVESVRNGNRTRGGDISVSVYRFVLVMDTAAVASLLMTIDPLPLFEAETTPPLLVMLIPPGRL